MKKFILKAMGVGAGIILAGSIEVRAEVLYQDTTTDLGSDFTIANYQQIGEEVWLGTLLPASLTNFSFEYYSPDTSWSGTVTADIKLYENNGPLTNGYASPGTLFYDSGSVVFPNPITYNGNSISNSLLAIFDLSDLLYPAAGGTPLSPSFILPTNFTFTITFAGLTAGETVGLPIFEPPTVGTNYGDYWYDASGNWELLTNSLGGPVAFGAEFNGTTTPTPEPTVLCLGALGAAAFTVLARRRQRRA
jgi:hypothetical protein